MTMQEMTWKEAEPEALPPPTALQKARGGLRVSAMILLTVVAMALFSLGRLMKRGLGDWVSFHYAVARFWSRSCLALLSLKPVIHGRPIRKGGVLVSNHVSWSDILALRCATRINFVSKAEVRDWPVVGYIAEICETVFIERKRSEAKKQQADLSERIHNDELLCIFAEGTSTDGLRVLPFKSTLMSVVFLEGIHEDAWVQPVTLDYRVNPRSGLPDNFYGWWGTMPFEGHIWSVACRSWGGRVVVTFHEPIKASDWSDRKALTAHCEAAVRSALPERVLAGPPPVA